MIKILNADNSFNKESAEFLKEKILDLWPDLDEHKKDIVQIHCGTRTTAGKTEDIDLTILASFETPRAYRPTWEKFKQIEIVWVKTFCTAVEVKHVPSQDVKISDGDLKVRRNESFENVTEQNHNQRFALFNTFKNLLDVEVKDLPFVTSNIIMMQCNSSSFSEMPTIKEKALFRDCDFADFLQKLTGQKGLQIMKKNQAKFNCGSSKNIDKALSCDLYKTLEASPVTKKRIENITKAFTDNAWRKGWLEDIGKKQVIIDGRGGTGKTVLLLSFVQKLAKEQNKKIILLTYNHALVTEIKRLSSYLDIDPDLFLVRTVMGYLRDIADFFGFKKINYPLKNYLSQLSDFCKWIEKNPEALKKRMKKLQEEGIKEKGIPRSDKADVIAAINPGEDGSSFDFDYWFVDEGQDFKEEEKELLRKLFGLKNSVISIGKGQCVRDFRDNLVHENNWNECNKEKIHRNLTITRKLNKVLRCDQMLVKMIQQLNKELGGEDLNIEQSDSFGGKIIVVEGSYFDDPLLHKRIMKESVNAGCSMVNLLFCTVNNKKDESDGNETVDGLEELGINSWEGLDPKERRDSLQDEDKARVVYYDSCRGLEGWAVICRKFDIYWNSLLKVASENKKLEEPLTFFPDDYIKRSDVRQPVIDHVLIPFTRATNTLVLEISSKETFIGSTLHKMSIDPSTRDIIEWRDPDKLAEDEIPY